MLFSLLATGQMQQRADMYILFFADLLFSHNAYLLVGNYF